MQQKERLIHSDNLFDCTMLKPCLCSPTLPLGNIDYEETNSTLSDSGDCLLSLGQAIFASRLVTGLLCLTKGKPISAECTHTGVRFISSGIGTHDRQWIGESTHLELPDSGSDHMSYIATVELRAGKCARSCFSRHIALKAYVSHSRDIQNIQLFQLTSIWQKWTCQLRD